MKALLTHLVIATLAVSLWTPSMAHAATGSWQWQDISNQLTTRTNRPVWAMAYANGNWFYTDGQDLNNGGQVYRFDGQTQVNITNDVRNAGVNRVDDIVSDNSNTVLFLQDVVRYDNQLKVASYQSGTFSNRTSQFQNALGLDEGMSMISGRNGNWMFVTTKTRLFSWNGVSNPVRVTLPSDLRNIQITDSMLYSLAQGTPAGSRYTLGVLPLSGSQWVVFGKSALHSNGYAIFRFDGVTFTKLEESSDAFFGGIIAAATNSNKIMFVVGISGASGFATHGKVTDGHTVQTFYGFTNSVENSTPNIQELISYDQNTTFIGAGTNWMLLNDKYVVLINSTDGIQNLGQARDFFVTASADGSGHILLGGAVSVLGDSNPTSPLTAKLALMTESGATSFNPVVTNDTNTSANTDTATGINRWTWLDPNVTTIKKDGNVTFYVGAQDNDGIKKIDIYVNGTVKRTCDLNNATGNQQCAYTVYANDYAQGTDIFVNAKVTDAKDKEAWTSSTTIRREADTTSTNDQVSDTGTGISQWTWLDPNQTTLKNNEKITFHVGSRDADGIKTVEVYVNGNVRRTCSYGNAMGNQDCSYDLWASDYPLNTDIFVNAKVTDGQSSFVWTQSYTLRRDGSNTNVNGTASNDISVWNWFENTADLKQGQSVMFRSQAWAEQGLNTMELFVNGQSKRSCSFSAAFGNLDCNFTVTANDYSIGSTISAYVKAKDKNGKTVTGDTKQLNIVAADNGSSGNTSGNTSTSGDTESPTAWHWLDPKKTSITTTETIRYWTEAWDNTGIKSMTQYVNGKPEYTCNFYPGTGNQKCWIEIAGRAHPEGSAFYVNTLVKDFAGNETWTDGETITITKSTTQTATNPSPSQPSTPAPNPAFDTWSYVTGPTTVTNGTKTTYAAGAWAEKGVRRITIYVNGKAQYPCTYWPGTGNQECRFDIVGSAYPIGTSVSVNALVTDFTNQEKWTQLVAIPVK